MTGLWACGTAVMGRCARWGSPWLPGLNSCRTPCSRTQCRLSRQQVAHVLARTEHDQVLGRGAAAITPSGAPPLLCLARWGSHTHALGCGACQSSSPLAGEQGWCGDVGQDWLGLAACGGFLHTAAAVCLPGATSQLQGKHHHNKPESIRQALKQPRRGISCHL